MGLLTFFGLAPWKAKSLPRGKPPPGVHVPDDPPEPLTPEERFAQDSDHWFARKVTAAMDRHREGIRNPPTTESEYSVHRWGEDFDDLHF